MVWFITVLVNVSLMGIVPPQGWIQGNVPFKDKAECEVMIPIVAPSIYQTIEEMTVGLGAIENITCMTEPEWLDLNVQMGHEVPPDLKFKVRPKTPEGT